MNTPNRNSRLATGLVTVVVVMLGLSYAAVPFYNWFCSVTGYGGTTGVAEAESSEIVDKVITVRFDGSLEAGMPWTFHPVARTMDLKIGETGLAFYEAYNPTSEPMAGQASYNVTPFAAGEHFIKIACFCFNMQVLEPGERVEMPVTFYVDPDILEDPEAKNLNEITLSYTMHRADLPETDAVDAGFDGNDNIRLAETRSVE